MAERQRVSMVGPPIVTLLLLIFLLQLPGFIHGFQPLFSFSANTTTHRVITQRAMLWKTAEVCRDIAAAAGRKFNLNVSPKLDQKKERKRKEKKSNDCCFKNQICVLCKLDAKFTIFI